MSRYYFCLRDGSYETKDPDGTILPDNEAALAHGRAVALELMRNCELRTRHWRLDVFDSTGKCVVQLPFARLDSTLDGLAPAARQLVERWSDGCLSLSEAVAAATKTMRQSRALVARSRGKPFVAAENGELV